MNCTQTWLSFALLLWVPIFSRAQSVEAPEDQEALAATADSVRAAFLRGNAEAAMRYHHPEVIKVIGPDKFLVGREAVELDLRATLENFNLEFVQNDTEDLRTESTAAFRRVRFSLRGTPKAGGEGWTFNGIALITSVRYAESPTGWAIIHEIIQPLP